MFTQQKVVINFSAGCFSSTDSLGESAEADSRNAHNFSNSPICVLPITPFWGYWVISDRPSEQINGTAAAKESEEMGTSVFIPEGGPGVPSGSLLTQLRSPCLRGGMIQDAVNPWPQAVSFSRGAAGIKYKCRKLVSNTEPSTSSSGLVPEEEARDPDK